MGILFDHAANRETLKEVARRMLLAARTAPKGRGIDNMVLSLVEEDEIKKISVKLKEMGKQYKVNAFTRDAEAISSVSVMLILGTKIKPLGLKKCGMCGFVNCEEKNKHLQIPCVFNTGDLGIAIGSAVSVAMDNRVDNRVMYTVGQVVLEMKLFGEDMKIAYGIPLSATSKNKFFDRNV